MPEEPLAGPTPAGTIDAMQHGRNNDGADRDLAARLRQICPELEQIAEANRTWLAAAVLMSVSRFGITQFLDLGCGWPSAGSVMDGALEASEDTRVACVDTDPDIAHPVYGYGPVLAGRGITRAVMVQADLTGPAGVLAHPGVTGLLDLSRPVLVTLGAVLHYWDAATGAGIVAGYAGALAPGSAVALTVVASPDPGKHEALRAAWLAGTGRDFFNLDPAGVAGLFGGLDVLPPGPGPVAGAWPADRGLRKSYLAGGIAIKN